MAMSQKIELPDAVYDKLLEAARNSGTTPVGWIAAHLQGVGEGNGASASINEEELLAADAWLEQCIVSLGSATGVDNEQIDADLAREYGDDHGDLYRTKKGS
jgi:hypothetical protein